jgi:murein DD-endopeptidase MepM/ murein hydrolase activator NlpD
MAITLMLLAAVGTAVPAVAAMPEGEFVFPQDPELTEFAPSFGRIKDDGRRHLGIDLMAPKLSPVYAVADGTIVRLGRGGRSGYIVKINHGDGVQSWYMHLNNDTPGTDDGRGGSVWAFAPGLNEGTKVAAGQFIGFVGDSGNAEGTESHTHFELRHYGVAIDPYPYLIEGWDAWWDEAVTADRLSDGLMEGGALEFFLDTRSLQDPPLHRSS